MKPIICRYAKRRCEGESRDASRCALFGNICATFKEKYLRGRCSRRRRYQFAENEDVESAQVVTGSSEETHNPKISRYSPLPLPFWPCVLEKFEGSFSAVSPPIFASQYLFQLVLRSTRFRSFASLHAKDIAKTRQTFWRVNYTFETLVNIDVFRTDSDGNLMKFVRISGDAQRSSDDCWNFAEFHVDSHKLRRN